MTPFDIIIEDLKKEIQEVVSRNGIYQFSTCDLDAYGWSSHKHHAMHSVARNGMEGMHVSFETPHGVTRWTITKK